MRILEDRLGRQAKNLAPLLFALECLVLVLLILVILIVAGIIYQLAGRLSDSKRFAPPGKLIDIGGGQRLHLVSSGQGTPAVILESGISATCLNWTAIRQRVSQFTQCSSYDRASLGWSDRARSPRLPSNIVEELHALVHVAGIQPPYILVGHSFGGMLVRAYSVKYPNEVAGLILIDPLCPADWTEPSPQQLRMLRRGVRLARRGAILARLGLVRAALSLLSRGARRVPQWIAKASSGKGESIISRIVGEVRKMAPETWPIIQAQWCDPKSFLGLSAYLESLAASCKECLNTPAPPRVPMIILSAANATPAELAERDDLVRGAPNRKHIIAKNSGHWIHLDQPDLVVHAIDELVQACRAAAPRLGDRVAE